MLFYGVYFLSLVMVSQNNTITRNSVAKLDALKSTFLFVQEEGIADVNEMMKQERPYPERRLRGVLEELASACSKYGTLTQGKSGGGASAGRTKLDKERVKLCQREVVCKVLVFYNI